MQGRLVTLSSPSLLILAHAEATNKDLRGSPARSVPLASPKGLPLLLGNFNGQMSLVGQGPGHLGPLSPLPHLSPSGDSSVLVVLFTLMESGLKHRTGGHRHRWNRGRHRKGQRALCQYGGGLDGP